MEFLLSACAVECCKVLWGGCGDMMGSIVLCCRVPEECYEVLSSVCGMFVECLGSGCGVLWSVCGVAIECCEVLGSVVKCWRVL